MYSDHCNLAYSSFHEGKSNRQDTKLTNKVLCLLHLQALSRAI